jgi:predicted unusual protein kinase regulating ubiquinone biosynthesis (AarF/ABC1/UbiB family)
MRFVLQIPASTIAALLALCVVLTSPTHAQIPDPTEMDLLKRALAANRVSTNLLSRESAPETFRFVEALVDELAVQQQKLIYPNKLINKVVIVDDATQGAWALWGKMLPKDTNYLIIQRGLLQELLKSGDHANGVRKLAGILGHELAHPTETLDPKSFKSLYGEEASQASEVFADANGMVIASEAGYGEEGLKEALEGILWDPEMRSSQSFFGALVQTHPQREARIGLLEGAMTYNSRQKGRVARKTIPPARPGLLKELELEALKLHPWKFKAPENLTEAAQRLKAIVDGYTYEEKEDLFRRIEYNRLLSWLDQQLVNKAPADLSAAELEAVYAFFEKISLTNSYETPKTIERHELRHIYSEKNGSAEFQKFPTHDEYLERSKFYHSKEHLDRVTQFMSSRNSSLYNGAVSEVVPGDVFTSTFKTQLEQFFARNDLRPNLISAFLDKDTSMARNAKSFALKLHAFDDFDNTVLPKLKGHHRFVYFRKANEEIVGFEGQGKFGEQTLKNPNFRARLKTNEASKPTRDLLRKRLNDFWNNRGRNGVLDIFSYDHPYDWRWVWRELGIPEDKGRSQLLQAIKEYTASAEYAELIQFMNPEVEGAWEAREVPTSYRTRWWMKKSLYPHLAGEKNSKISNSPILKKLARQKVAIAVPKEFPEEAEKLFATHLRTLLAQPGFDIDSYAQAEALQKAYVKEMWGDTLGNDLASKPVYERAWAQEISRSKLPEKKKQDLLKKIFLSTPEAVENWLVDQFYRDKTKTWPEIASLLEKQGVTVRPLDLLLSADPETREIYHFVRLADFGDELVQRVKRLTAPAALEFLKKTFPQKPWEYGNRNYRELRRIKPALVSDLLPRLNTPEKKLELHKILTASGPTRETDSILRSVLDSRKSTPFRGRELEGLRWALKESKIESSISLDVAKAVLQPEIDQLGAKPSRARLEKFFKNRFDIYAPGASLERDRWLEKVAFGAGISGKDLDELVETRKFYNWRRPHPSLVNLSSSVSQTIETMDVQTRRDLIFYLQGKSGTALPESVRGHLASDIMTDARKIGLGSAKKTLEAQIAKIESLLLDHGPNDRIPAYSMALRAGPTAPRHRQDYVQSVSRQYLGYAPDSKEEKLLLAYFDVIPKHEITPSLAYMLSQADGNERSIVRMFEVFQAVGIKFGQLSAVWKIFGDEVAREAEVLKDGALPLTKSEIEKILDETLTPAERSKIKDIKKVLGSASFKTVVEIELKDGTSAVAMVMRPFAERQVRTNLELSLEFVKALKRRGFPLPDGMFASLVKHLTTQMVDETKLSLEAVKVKRAESVISSLTQKHDGVRMSVPGLHDDFQVRDHLLFMHKANGVGWKDVPRAHRKPVGRAIVDKALDLLLEKGWFDPDRHAGNFIVEITKSGKKEIPTVHWIDFGQALDFDASPGWRSDDPFKLVQFLRSIQEGDAASLVKDAAALSDSKSVTRATRDVALSKLQAERTRLSQLTFADRLVESMNLLESAGLRIEGKYSVGALKGLLILQRENYVSEAEFIELFAKKAKALMLRKPLLAAGTEVKRRFLRCVSGALGL